MSELKEIDALELAQTNYTEYSKYIAQGRSYPCIKDGSKSAYKRAIYGMWKDCPRSTIKVAKLAAAALPYHPHPTSISGVIIQLGEKGNKLKLMDTQGNWGDSSKGIEASAERYIGGMLSDLALELFCDGIEYAPTILGEIDEKEPEALPAYIPLCFINGQSGIPAGLPKLNIPPLNLLEMMDYAIDVLKHKDTSYESKKLPTPNIGVPIISTRDEWEKVLLNGNGTIKLAPVMELKDNTIYITALPPSKSVENVRKIINKEILLEKVDLRDESTYNTSIVIEKVPYKQCDMKSMYKTLYNKLCSNAIYSFSFFDNDKIYVNCGYREVIRQNLNFLIETHKNRLANQIKDTQNKLNILYIIQKLKVSEISSLDFDSAIDYIVTKFKTDEDTAKKVLQKPISYLTKAHTDEITKLEEEIKSLKDDDSDIYEFLIKRYKELKKKVSAAIKDTFVETTFK